MLEVIHLITLKMIGFMSDFYQRFPDAVMTDSSVTKLFSDGASDGHRLVLRRSFPTSHIL